MKAKTRPASRKHREVAHLPHQEPERHQAVDAAARAYADARDTRMACTVEEHEAHTQLLAEMNKANLKRYVTSEGLTVTVNEQQKVKVAEDKPAAD